MNFGIEWHLSQWDERYTERGLNEIHNLIDEPVREDEENRYLLAGSMVFCHIHLSGALSWEASGKLVHNSLAQKRSLEGMLGTLGLYLEHVRHEAGPEGDADDRVSFTDYKRVRNLISAILGEIDAYLLASGINAEDEAAKYTGSLSIIRTQMSIEREFNEKGSVLDTLALNSGVSTVRHGSRN